MTFLAYRHLPGEYVMVVTVLKEYFFSKRKVAEGSCKFLLTRDIVGKIVVSQDGHILPDDQTIVSTNKTTNFTFQLHDPSGYFTNSSDSLSWKGNIWLRRGDVVSLQVSCNGSAPYNYCWKYLPGNATSNSTANLTCDEPISTNQCQFPLVHYFPQDGSHFIAILVSNIVQAKPYIKNIEVHIYDVPRSGLLSTIILPIVCSLLAFVILVTGIAYHIHTRNQLQVEVADFDFQRPDLELTEKTFWEHLLGAWRDAFPSWSKQPRSDVDSAGEGDSLTAPGNERRFGDDTKKSSEASSPRGPSNGTDTSPPSVPAEKSGMDSSNWTMGRAER
ncbi:hypothetical protein HPB50_008753 [Hyalomma asiaticum]|uniref:Uncharacterized protein n=1 Tax=Hyalomma asiaticum TaxID=266040 RepID=A0ACB7T6R7_HYAAI|nr:hypothetical protein HPB50_008753 [Hyalomma asiaticum]